MALLLIRGAEWCRTLGSVDSRTQLPGTTQAGDGVSGESGLHLTEGIHPFIIGEARMALGAVKQVVLRSGCLALLGGGIADGRFREAKGLLFEDGVDQQGEVDFLGWHEEGHRDIDGVFSVIVL